MAQIMVVREKHGTRYLDMSKGIGPTAAALVRERIAQFRYESKEEELAKRALSGVDPSFTPWHFLRSRVGEYESVAIATLEELA